MERLDEDKSKVLLTADETDNLYFQSYDNLQSHQCMIADDVRTSAYRWAILHSCELLYKKTVLDVGCGTGILSVFCVQAGARKVYAVEASREIANVAQKILEANNVKNNVELINQPIEKCQLNEKVDAIVSEWMGYTLFSEWMIFSVVRARDDWLKDGGLLFPHKASLYITVIRETKFQEERTKFWEETQKLYSVDMSYCKNIESDCLRGKLIVQEVLPQEIVAKPVEIVAIDLYTVTADDLMTLSRDFELTTFGSCTAEGFCLYFTVQFPDDSILSTEPSGEPTHWLQTALYVKPFNVEQDSIVKGVISLRRAAACPRSLSVEVNYSVLTNGVVVNEGQYEFREGC